MIKNIILGLFLALLTACTSTDLLRTAETGAILVDGRDKVKAVAEAVKQDIAFYSDQDIADLRSNSNGLLALYNSAVSLRESSTRKAGLVEIVALLPTARVHARNIHKILSANLDNNTASNRAIISSALFDMEVLEENYQHALSGGNRQQIRDNAVLYLRTLAPILLAAAERL